jgi:hypothetical protein
MVGVLGWLKFLMSALSKQLPERRHKRLKFVADDQMNRWMAGTALAGKPAMFVESRWFVANPSADYVRIVKVTFTRRLSREHWWSLPRSRQITPATTFLTLSRGHRVQSPAGQVVIPPHQQLDVEATFVMTEPLPNRKRLKAVTTFVDGFGRTVKLRATYPNSILPIVEHRKM